MSAPGRVEGVCSRRSAPGGGSAPGGVCSRGVSTPMEVSASGGCLLGGCLVPGGWYPSMHQGRYPPVNRMTNRCKNITLATTSLRPVIIGWSYDI